MEEIVEYARVREIDIIPEIDMPGHMQAAISAYPELGCTDMTLAPRCTWGISQHILNPQESTLNFMRDVLDEIMDIFPYTFIHVGGGRGPQVRMGGAAVGSGPDGQAGAWSRKKSSRVGSSPAWGSMSAAGTDG